ncbi:hypothetical protein CONCODRAFT_86064 [Conidiobolus coronatus NRRL 28638]|uniref:Uncharacterized protein n=1 Tax=Conidiobolus coronatus (strain ATCC 28846 / CBS 209.66 / NRRL 28638) TaxID=796925 RepID=A0A137P2R8_CONC2|nr:hypothetical protein CONCODRAFT_86064 [Conidiobolus coronatus NRRL 28638]|eukprot:KXN69209.1 hypothetical protein CONCODRAFT_86064 [Conidiobolus coronatus NRRL 28638]
MNNLLIMIKCLALAISDDLSKYLKLSLNKFKTKIFESIYKDFCIDELLKLKHSWQFSTDYELRVDNLTIPSPISTDTLNDLSFINYNLPIYNFEWNKLELDKDTNYYCIPDFALIDAWKRAFNQTLDSKMIKVFLSEFYLPPDTNRLLPLIFKESITKEQMLKLSELNIELMLVFIDSLEQFPQKFNMYTQLILEIPINVNYLNLISNLFAFEIQFKEDFYQKLINNLINYCQQNTTENEANNSNDQIRKLLLTTI